MCVCVPDIYPAVIVTIERGWFNNTLTAQASRPGSLTPAPPQITAAQGYRTDLSSPSGPDTATSTSPAPPPTAAHDLKEKVPAGPAT